MKEDKELFLRRYIVWVLAQRYEDSFILKEQLWREYCQARDRLRADDVLELVMSAHKLHRVIRAIS